LFIVNEINLNLHHHKSADQWGNNTPPETSEGFTQERVGNVLRYKNGTVSKAEGQYSWYRPQPGEEGAIGYWVDQESDELGLLPITDFQPLEVYSTSTVFACGPFLPFIHGSGDVTVDDSEAFDGWHALHFLHDGAISRASSNGDFKVLAGRDAGFIDSLLPRAYRNTMAGAPHSAGLGGEIGLVIGLMALSQQPHGALDNALQHCWSGNQWTGHRHANACRHYSCHHTICALNMIIGPTVRDDPRGVLVQIALDPRGQPGQSEADINHFEWHGIAVSG
jgi:hypothetical protein